MHEPYVASFLQNYFNELKKDIDLLDFGIVNKILNALADAYQQDRQVFIIGNGGSAATASHFACDLGKSILKDPLAVREKRLRVLSLTDNMAAISAISNDIGYEDIFYQQLKNILQRGDVVIAISASGNSPNVVKAVQYAKEQGAVTVGLLGFHTGGKLGSLVDHGLIVRDNHYGRVEDIHLATTHLLCNMLAELKRKFDAQAGESLKKL